MTVDSRPCLQGPPEQGTTPGVLARRRGEIFRALFESLSPPDQQWVVDRIRHYLQLNAEEHIEARL